MYIYILNAAKDGYGLVIEAPIPMLCRDRSSVRFV